MQATPTEAGLQAGYELRFRALSAGIQSCSFPCDADGHVDLDALSERSRNAYFFARIVIGHELATPEVHRLPTVLTSPASAAPSERVTRAAVTT
jgi:hypothetical protein